MERNRYGKMFVMSSPSGAGKTTLLQLLGTLDYIQAGSLIINNKEVSQLSQKELAKFRNKEIGFVFQFHNLLVEFTALENVCLPAFIAGTSRKKAEQKGRRA